MSGSLSSPRTISCNVTTVSGTTRFIGGFANVILAVCGVVRSKRIVLDWLIGWLVSWSQTLDYGHTTISGRESQGQAPLGHEITGVISRQADIRGEVQPNRPRPGGVRRPTTIGL